MPKTYEIIVPKQFLRQFRKLDKGLQLDVRDKLELLKDQTNHERLKVHKLKGKLEGRYSFSINYSIRVIFSFPKSGEVLLLHVGPHSIYNK